MKLGFVSAILPNYNLEQVVDFANEVGYECVEFACWPIGKATRRYGGVTHIDIEELNSEKVEFINNYCRNNNVEISALGYYPNPLDPNDEVARLAISHILKMIEAAKHLGLKNINTFIGRNKILTIRENMELFKNVWKPIIEKAEKNEIFIGIENCPMYFTEDEWPGGNNLASSPEIWNEMFTIFDSKYFGLNYDPSHLHLQGMDYIAPIYDFSHKLFHIHIKDILVYQNKIDYKGIFTYPSEYSEPKIPGLGGIDWGRFMSALYDIRYQGPVCVEIEDKSFEDSTSRVEQALKLSYKHISQFI